MEKPVIIIDGYGFVFRAYHVQPPLTSPSGAEVGALYGFTAMLIKLLSDFKPADIVIVFDTGGKNFRHTLYSDYKATRPPIDEALRTQLPLVRIAAEAVGIKIREQRGVEADDVIASMATQLARLNRKVVIISSDKDLMQLICDHTSMYDPMKSKYITHVEVEEKFGVAPQKVRDVLALIGDKSDNIPGVPGIGPKTAAELITHFGDLHHLLDNISQIKQDKRRELLGLHKENAILSWNLIELQTNLEVDIQDTKWSPENCTKLHQFLTDYGFRSLIPRAAKLGITLDTTAVTNVKSAIGDVLTHAQKNGILGIYIADNKVYLSNVLGMDVTIETQQDIEKCVLYLCDQSVKKITVSYKKVLHFFDKHTNVSSFIAFEDISLMHYVCSAGLQQQVEQIVIDNGSYYLFKLFNEYRATLYQHKALSLYYDIDLKLCHSLYKMEKIGIAVDADVLRNLSKKFAIDIERLEQDIYKIAGTTFNIGSPKQLGEILFEKLGIPSVKTSSKTKAYSTDAEILESLSDAGYEIADLLLQWRQFTKLKSTYSDALIEQINHSTGRIHTTFVQNSTSTGRLSSHNPNLQNIPTRTADGQKIRSAFVARPGCVLVSADYSQIELRILSHIANIDSMKQDFLDGVDIHTSTASQIFNISRENITPEYRHKAKAINFGIIYGISAFGLSKQLGISRPEAAEYIERYFAKYPGIQNYMTTTKAFAKEHGYVLNLFGRKCFIPNIHDKNHVAQNFADRAAINAPIQGTAADIAKMAMIRLDEQLINAQLTSRLLLQIHDELIIETPVDELEAVMSTVKKVMENIITIEPQLVVDIHHASNWNKL